MTFLIPLETVGGLKVDPSVKVKLASLSDGPSLLRIAVDGGGCSGFQYRIELSSLEDDDFSILWEEGSLGVIVDPISAPFLDGAVLKYTGDIIGERFEIENPNASSSCGCGLSFSV